METSGLPFNGRALVTARGRMCIWALHEKLLVVRLVGHGSEQFAAPVIAEFERMAPGNRAVQLFFDAELLETYDSPLRTRLTDCFVQGRTRLAALHVLLQSRLVAMGVSVANLALGGMVTTHTKRVHFAVALDEALVRNGVAGFSAHSLAAA